MPTLLKHHKNQIKINKNKSKTSNVDNKQLETTIEEPEEIDATDCPQLRTHNTPVDNNVINTDYTNNSTYTPQVYPTTSTQLHHHTWPGISVKWTAPPSKNPPTNTSMNRGNVPQVPLCPMMNTNHHENEDDPTGPIPTHPVPTHKYWRLAASDSHQPHQFLQCIDNIKLDGDSISQLCKFYERIRLAFNSSFTKVIHILPPFRELSPQYPFGNILVPNNEMHMGYYAVLNTYNWFGTAL